MASAIIHMCVAKKVNEKLNMDIRLLSLGSIAPDLAKQIGMTKDKAHFVDDIPNVPDMDSFLNKYGNSLNKSFEMGYYIHLLTDKYWFSDFIEDKMGCYNNKFDNKLSRKEILQVIYNDYSLSNKPLISLYNPCIDIFFDDFVVDSEIDEIPVSKLNILVDNMRNLVFEDVEGQFTILSMDDICNFIEKCSELILLDIERNIKYGRNL